VIVAPQVLEVHDGYVVVEYPELDDEEKEDVYPIVTNNGKTVVRCRPTPPASTRTDWDLDDLVRFPTPVPRTACVRSRLRSCRCPAPQFSLWWTLMLGVNRDMSAAPSAILVLQRHQKLWRGTGSQPRAAHNVWMELRKMNWVLSVGSCGV
jgi:hypothetical protein